MRKYVTDERRTFARSRVERRVSSREPEMRLVKVYPHIQFQEAIGFGAALTEASASVFAHIPESAQREFLNLCFSGSGNDYSLCRTTIQSCDFSLGPRAYMDRRDTTLQSFSIDGDRALILPFVRAAARCNERMQFLASPWSPPAWAKTNKSMLQGGKLARRDYGTWAHMMARYVREYREEGVRINRVTLQNEPNAVQRWESCVYNAASEARFACDVREALDAESLGDVRVFIWDHNKEGMFDRASACLTDPEAANVIDGVAFHWYSGDHFKAVEATRLLIGERELLFTEGCDSYSNGDATQELPHAEHYAHEIIGDLEAGAQGAIDWNILLDAEGGPNHVGNYCDAPIMFDADSGNLRVRLPFYYLGHFSKFIQPGARRLLSTCYTTRLETTCFKNPDGSCALVVLNRTGDEIPFEVALDINAIQEHIVYPIDSPAHSIMTITW